MKKRNVRKLWDRLQRELGDAHTARESLKEYGWTFAFDKAKRRIGHTKFQEKIISLSITLIRNGLSKDQVEETLRHEIAHAIDYENRGTSDHGAEWKSMARKCGANPERKESIPNEVVPDYRWYRRCPNCETIVGQYYSKPTSDKYVCKSCRGDLVVVKGPGHPDVNSSS